jgi:hypothetical protein
MALMRMIPILQRIAPTKWVPQEKTQAAERLASLCGFVLSLAATFQRGQSSPSRMVPNRCFDGRYQAFAKRWRKKWRAGLAAGFGRAWQMASFEGSRNTPPARPPEFDTN